MYINPGILIGIGIVFFILLILFIKELSSSPIKNIEKTVTKLRKFYGKSRK